MKILYGTALLVFTYLISGCASISYHEGQLRDEYDPLIVDDAVLNGSALIKAVDGLHFAKVDRKRIANFAKLAMGFGPDSILVTEGKHTLMLTSGRDLAIGSVNYERGHEYLIDYVSKKDGNRVRIYYWVKDLTDDKVVFGKEITREELIARDAENE